MSIATTSQTPVNTGLRSRNQAWDELDSCVCCGSRFEVVRASRFGYVPFCQSCLDRSLHPGMWDELGEGD